MTHDDGLGIALKFREPTRNLVHGHMYDAGDARKLQFPCFAHIQYQRLLATITPCLQLLHRNFPHHARALSELKTFRPCRVIEWIDGGFEQPRAVPGLFGSTGHQQCLLRQARAHHDE